MTRAEEVDPEDKASNTDDHLHRLLEAANRSESYPQQKWVSTPTKMVIGDLGAWIKAAGTTRSPRTGWIVSREA